MLGKLLKHEYRATAPFVGLISFSLIVLAALARLFWSIDSDIEILSIPSVITTFFYGVLAVTSMALITAMAIRRYYVNVYGDEGYLTLTLPVKREHIILSKLIVTLTWYIVIFVTLLVTVCIWAFDYVPDVINTVADGIRWFVDHASAALKTQGIVLVVEFIILCLVMSVQSILMLYASISIGQFFTKHRIIGSVIGYMALSVVSRIINSLFAMLMGVSMRLSSGLNYFFSSDYRSGFDALAGINFHIYIRSYIILMALLAVGYFLFSDYIMHRAVNLQ